MLRVSHPASWEEVRQNASLSTILTMGSLGSVIRKAGALLEFNPYTEKEKASRMGLELFADLLGHASLVKSPGQSLSV